MVRLPRTLSPSSQPADNVDIQAFREFELFRRYSEEPTPDTIEGTVLEEALRGLF